MEWGDAKEVQEGGDTCVPMADSCWCMAETNTTLQSNYPPIKNKSILKKETVLSLGKPLEPGKVNETDSPPEPQK